MSYRIKINYSNNSDYDKAGVLIYSINKNEKYYLLGRSRKSPIWNSIEISRNIEDGSNPILTASRGFVIGTNNMGKSWNESIKIRVPLYHPLMMHPPIGIVTPGIPLNPSLHLNPIIKKPSSWSNYRNSSSYQWIYKNIRNNSEIIKTKYKGKDLVYYKIDKLSYDPNLPERFIRSLNSLSARMSDYDKLAWVKESELKTLTDCSKVNTLPSLNNEVVNNQLCHLIQFI